MCGATDERGMVRQRSRQAPRPYKSEEKRADLKVGRPLHARLTREEERFYGVIQGTTPDGDGSRAQT